MNLTELVYAALVVLAFIYPVLWLAGHGWVNGSLRARLKLAREISNRGNCQCGRGKSERSGERF